MSRRSKKLPKPGPAKRPDVPHNDGWFNAFNGLGVEGYDKRMGAEFILELLTQVDAEEIWRGDHMAAKAVEKIPDEALREGFGVKIEGEKDLAEEMDQFLLEDLDVLETVRTAWYYARAYGGSGCMLGADDGARDLTNPLNEDAIRSFDWINIMTPRELVPVTWYADPAKKGYGRIETYRVVPLDAPPGADISKWPIVHESRILRMNGIQTSRWASLRNPVQPGWDDSVFVRVIRIIQGYADACAAAGILMVDFAPPVLKMVGLARLLAAQSPSQAQQTIQGRAAGIERSKSNARAVIIDEHEEYKRETVSVAGLPELLDKCMLQVASALDMPVSLLMGQSPAGLSATGASDIRFFYDRVASLQKQKLRPWLRRVIKLAFLSKAGPTKGEIPENWDVDFPALWQLTQLEQAQVRYTQAQTDQIYIATQVLLPEEVVQSRFLGDTYSTETQVDLKARAQLQADRVAKNTEMGAKGLNPDGTPNPQVLAAQQAATTAAAEADSGEADKPGTKKPPKPVGAAAAGK